MLNLGGFERERKRRRIGRHGFRQLTSILPAELKLHFLSFLPPVDLLNVRLLNRYWNSLLLANAFKSSFFSPYTSLCLQRLLVFRKLKDAIASGAWTKDDVYQFASELPGDSYDVQRTQTLQATIVGSCRRHKETIHSRLLARCIVRTFDESSSTSFNSWEMCEDKTASVSFEVDFGAIRWSHQSGYETYKCQPMENDDCYDVFDVSRVSGSNEQVGRETGEEFVAKHLGLSVPCVRRIVESIREDWNRDWDGDS